MGLIDKLRFHTILARSGIPEALQDTFDEQTSPPATKADLENVVLELKRDGAEREARQAQMMLVVVGVVLAAIAIAVVIILAVLA